MRPVFQSVLASAFLLIANPASASQWWTISHWPPEDCVDHVDHGHSPAELFEYEGTIGGDPEILDREFPGAVVVEFNTSEGKRFWPFFRTIDLCQALVESFRHNLDQYR